MLRKNTLTAVFATALLFAASCNKDSGGSDDNLPSAAQLTSSPWTTDYTAVDINDNAVLDGNETQAVGLATYTFREDNTGRIVGSINGQQSSLNFTWQLLDGDTRLRIASSQSVDTGYIQIMSGSQLLLKYGIENVRWKAWKR